MWSPSYYVGTAGHVSAKTIERYIKDQQTEWKRGSSTG
jgi:putative transposase